MKRLFISALATVVFAHVAIAQDTTTKPAPPVPADQMPMDKAPPPADPSAPMALPTGDMPIDQSAPMPPQPPTQPDQPMEPSQAMQQTAPGGIIYQPSADASPPPPAATEPYPVCSKTVQDQCRNPNEGGKKNRKK